VPLLIFTTVLIVVLGLTMLRALPPVAAVILNSGAAVLATLAQFRSSRRFVATAVTSVGAVSAYMLGRYYYPPALQHSWAVIVQNVALFLLVSMCATFVAVILSDPARMQDAREAHPGSDVDPT
jgi:membrane protein DedA with SNARE-associated domain